MKFIIKAEENHPEACFVRKPLNLQEVINGSKSCEPECYIVEETLDFDSEEYEKATMNFFDKEEWSWLQEFGGFNGECRSVVKITCLGKPTLLIDSQGFDYARYVAIEPTTQIDIETKVKEN